MKKRIVLSILISCFFLHLSILANTSDIQLNYNRVDKYALNIPSKYEKNITSLIKYFNDSVSTDREKARIIYRWIADRIAYDSETAKKQFFNRVLTLPETILNRRLAVCEGYANLYKKLAEKLGLQCEIIGGWNKGGINGKPNHVWNAVKIDGKWEFVEATYAAGITPNWKFIKKFNSFYFCPSPEKFIFTHFPIDPKWQLLNNPISKEQFKKSITPISLFNIGFDAPVFSERERKIIVSGEKIITLTGTPGIIVSAQLYMLKNNNKEAVPGGVIMQGTNGKYEARVSPPKAGKYSLCLLGKYKSSDHFSYLVWYEIEATKTPVEWFRYPTLNPTFHHAKGFIKNPIHGVIKKNTTVNFSIYAEGIEKMNAVFNRKWISFKKDENKFYHTTLQLTSETGELKILVTFPGSRSWNYFINYNVE